MWAFFTQVKEMKNSTSSEMYPKYLSKKYPPEGDFWPAISAKLTEPYIILV